MTPASSLYMVYLFNLMTSSRFDHSPQTSLSAQHKTAWHQYVEPQLWGQHHAASVSPCPLSRSNCSVTQTSWQAECCRDVSNMLQKLLLAAACRQIEVGYKKAYGFLCSFTFQRTTWCQGQQKCLWHGTNAEKPVGTVADKFWIQ